MKKKTVIIIIICIIIIDLFYYYNFDRAPSKDKLCNYVEMQVSSCYAGRGAVSVNLVHGHTNKQSYIRSDLKMSDGKVKTSKVEGSINQGVVEIPAPNDYFSENTSAVSTDVVFGLVLDGKEVDCSNTLRTIPCG